MPYGSYWHSCDVLPEGRRPRGHSHNCANNSHMVTREAQATTNLLPVPGKVRLSKLPKPKPARCTLFPWIQLSVPHGIYWHTSYGVLRVCYFTLRATMNVVDNRWASWVSPCGSASITVNTNTHAHHFCYEEKWPPTHGHVWNTTATPLDLSNGAFSEKTPQIF